MASISAELYVAGHVFRVTHCHFGTTQPTDLRGRVSAQVRYDLVQLVLNMPIGDVLPVWAADPYQRQATAIVFLDSTGGQPLETLRLPVAYCVRYREHFVSGDAQEGAYQCFLTVADPTGWTLAPGGLASAFAALAGHSQGEPGAGATAVSRDAPSSQVSDNSSSPAPMDPDSDSEMDLDPEEADGPEDDPDPDPEDDSDMDLNPEEADQDQEEYEEASLSKLSGEPFFQRLFEDSDYEQLFKDTALEELFKNQDLLIILRYFEDNSIVRKHKDLVSVWEQTVLGFYTTKKGYAEFNLALRGKIPMTDFFGTQERVLNGALEKLPKFQGQTIRGTGESEIQRFADARVGDVIEYENFVSSSTDVAIADNYMGRKGGKYVLQITSKTGVQLAEVGLLDEDEVLFQSKKRFRVTGKIDHSRLTNDGLLVNEVYLEEI